MFGNHRVVCVTPAGRRRYMELLVPQVLASGCVDEYQIWVNTRDEGDLAYLRSLPLLDPRIRLVESPLPPNGNATINQFFTGCIDPDAVYVRFDDDIVHIEPGGIERLVAFRLENPGYFLVFPLIVNNAVCSHILQENGVLSGGGQYVPAQAMDKLAWADPAFAEGLHRAFLHLLRTGDVGRLRFDRRLVAMNRVSINCISWLGATFAGFGGVVPDGQDEEEWLTVRHPGRHGLVNCIHGEVVVAHFAFYPQRERLDATDLLEQYRDLAGLSRPVLSPQVIGYGSPTQDGPFRLLTV